MCLIISSKLLCCINFLVFTGRFFLTDLVGKHLGYGNETFDMFCVHLYSVIHVKSTILHLNTFIPYIIETPPLPVLSRLHKHNMYIMYITYYKTLWFYKLKIQSGVKVMGRGNMLIEIELLKLKCLFNSSFHSFNDANK